MHRILIGLCEQEISSFNPVPTTYESFEVHQGGALIDAHRGADTCLRGALDVFESRSDVQVIPVFGAKAPSGGTLCGDGFRRIAEDFWRPCASVPTGERALFFPARCHGRRGGWIPKAISSNRPGGCWGRASRSSSRSTCTAF